MAKKPSQTHWKPPQSNKTTSSTHSNNPRSNNSSTTHSTQPTTTTHSTPHTTTNNTSSSSSSTTTTTISTTTATPSNNINNNNNNNTPTVVSASPSSSSSNPNITTATPSQHNTNMDLPYGAFKSWDQYRSHTTSLIDLEFGLQTQLSPQNSFSIVWSVSQHLLTNQMNLIATIIVPIDSTYIDVENLKLGTRIQFLHPTAAQFKLTNPIPITGFVDNIITEADDEDNPESDEHWSIDIIIDTISTTFLRNPSLILPTLTSTTAPTTTNTSLLSNPAHTPTTPATSFSNNASPLSTPLHTTLAQQPLSEQGFLKVFSSINFPTNNYQIIIHTPQLINYYRMYYNLYSLQLPSHLENTIIGQYGDVSNPLEAIGFKPDAIPSKHDIVRKDVIHATTTIPSIFDQQQVDTLHYAIQQPFCVIQAPPGCGKTEMISTAGLKIQAILKRQYQSHQLRDEDYTPVLVTGSNEVSLFNEVGKYIFTRSEEVLVISNTFTIKWLHDPILRPTLLQSIIAETIFNHPEDLLYNFLSRIFPDYDTFTQRQRFLVACKLHTIINDDSLMLSMVLPGIQNHYINPSMVPLPKPNVNFSLGDLPNHTSLLTQSLTQSNSTTTTNNNSPIPPSFFSTHTIHSSCPVGSTTPTRSAPAIANVDTLQPTLLFNPYHFFERLSLAFSQDEVDAFTNNDEDNNNNNNNDDEDEDEDNDENNRLFDTKFNPDIQPLSLQDTLLFCEHYHELQLDLIRSSNIVCCANELMGNKLMFHKLKFHHVLMDDTQSVLEPITLFPLNYGAKQALLSYDGALLRPTVPFNPQAKHQRLSTPLAQRLLGLNDWQQLKPLPTNANKIQTMKLVPTAFCNVQYRVHPKLFEYPYQHHYKQQYPNLLNQLTLPRDIHSKNYDVLFASVYKKDISDKHSDCPRQFGPKYFDWAVRRLENDRAGMYNRSLEKFPWPNDQLPFLFLSTHNPQFEATLKAQNITHNTTNPLEIQYADCLLAHFVHLGLNLDDLGIIVPFPEQIQEMYTRFSSPDSALSQALIERRLLVKTTPPISTGSKANQKSIIQDQKGNVITLPFYFRAKLKIAPPEHFQSVDCKILIFSTTRCNGAAASPNSTHIKSLGPVLANPSSINLAMTRARNAVMFLGDHNTLLEHSAAWTKLISYAAENNALMLPTMAKRFVPWLATSRSFIYDSNRRKREMILHQFLPQLLAQSLSSPPTSKDPIENKGFKQQCVEFEEFDTILQYYRQLLGERQTFYTQHTSELDIYDDGFNKAQNLLNFNSLVHDTTISTNTTKSQTLGLVRLLQHHCQPPTQQPQPTIPVTATTPAPPAPVVPVVPVVPVTTTATPVNISTVITPVVSPNATTVTVAASLSVPPPATSAISTTAPIQTRSSSQTSTVVVAPVASASSTTPSNINAAAPVEAIQGIVVNNNTNPSAINVENKQSPTQIASTTNTSVKKGGIPVAVPTKVDNTTNTIPQQHLITPHLHPQSASSSHSGILPPQQDPSLLLQQHPLHSSQTSISPVNSTLTQQQLISPMGSFHPMTSPTSPVQPPQDINVTGLFDIDLHPHLNVNQSNPAMLMMPANGGQLLHPSQQLQQHHQAHLQHHHSHHGDNNAIGMNNNGQFLGDLNNDNNNNNNNMVDPMMMMGASNNGGVGFVDPLQYHQVMMFQQQMLFPQQQMMQNAFYPAYNNNNNPNNNNMMIQPLQQQQPQQSQSNNLQPQQQQQQQVGPTTTNNSSAVKPNSATSPTASNTNNNSQQQQSQAGVSGQPSNNTVPTQSSTMQQNGMLLNPYQPTLSHNQPQMMNPLHFTAQPGNNTNVLNNPGAMGLVSNNGVFPTTSPFGYNMGAAMAPPMGGVNGPQANYFLSMNHLSSTPHPNGGLGLIGTGAIPPPPGMGMPQQPNNNANNNSGQNNQNGLGFNPHGQGFFPSHFGYNGANMAPNGQFLPPGMLQQSQSADATYPSPVVQPVPSTK